MKICWDERHGAVLAAFLDKLDKNDIRWFILRGFEGLPDHNPSKDVDVMVEVGKEKKAARFLKETFREKGIQYLSEVQFGHAHCYVGMDINKEISIHIDLIEGYVSKGYEVFTFDELYKHVIKYNDLYVLDDFMNGIMLLVYKIFGYHKAKLKEAYQQDIKKAYFAHRSDFKDQLVLLLGNGMAEKISGLIETEDFSAIVKMEPEFTKRLKRYTILKRPLKTVKYSIEFLNQKIVRIIFSYRKYAKTFAVMAPDGTGKTTFLDTLLEQMNYYYVNDSEDNRFHVYHFRPSILPNLGAIGEKTGVMKQDTDFTNPHRSKPANPLSSLIRIAYYTLDYIVGWQKCVRKDVHYDRYSIFDRYSYDFIVDPLRTKLNLPYFVRKFFVSITPQPKVVFFLDASSEIVYARKQELTLAEIERQGKAYRELALSQPERFKIIDAEQTPEEMAKNAVKILLDTYTERL